VLFLCEVHIFSIFGRLYHINSETDMHIFSIFSRKYHIGAYQNQRFNQSINQWSSLLLRPMATFPEHTILSTITSTLAQPLRRTSTSQSQRSTSSSSTGQVGSRRPRILCLECSRLCSQRQNGSVHRRNCMVQLPSVRQHQHSSPAHIVIPAVNPISAPPLATSSHGNNASPQQPNVLLPPPTNTPPADIIVQLPGSIHLAPPTHLEANHYHPHLPPMPRPPSAPPRLTIHQWATSHFHLLRLACASRTRGEYCDTIRLRPQCSLTKTILP